jgi:hypothetical protein
MVPVRERDHRIGRIDIIHARIRVVRVVDDERPTETVAVLRAVVGVVPERAGLAARVERVRELLARRDGALGHECGPVRPGRVLLEEAVPVDRCCCQHRGVVQLVLDGDFELGELVGVVISLSSALWDGKDIQAGP